MDRHLYLIETGTTTPKPWPSIALASAELRRPRHLRVVTSSSESTASPAPVVRPPRLDGRRR